MTEMNVAVTGAAGHVGANLVRVLTSQGMNVRALVHVRRQALEGLKADTIECDIRNLESLCKAFDGADVVYHLAGYISLLTDEWQLLESVNVNGTRNVVEACLRCGVRRLIHFSSIHAVTQEPSDTQIDEFSPLVDSQNVMPYNRSKAAGEKEVLKGIEKGLDAIIIRPTAIIGPYDYQPSYLGKAILSLANGKLPAIVSGGYDWVDVRDVVEGAIQAEQRAQAGAVYFLSGHWVSMYDMAKMIAGITSIPAPGFICPLWLARFSAPIVTGLYRLAGKQPLFTTASTRAICDKLDVSHEKATRELDYHPRSFQETLIDTLRWFEENGQLVHPLKLP